MLTSARIIDANANRAREGLRTLEDIARFALDDSTLSDQAKQLRHDLATAVATLPISPRERLAARDTPEDVGTRISNQTERTRPDYDAIAAAAAARATEALRVLEETAKTLGRDGADFEHIRYAVYELERRLRLRLTTKVLQWRLCVLLTESLCARPWLEVAEAALSGGADCLQLREKDLDERELLTRASALVELVGDRASVIINDRADIALLAGATGVHLGQDDLPVAAVRRLSRQSLTIGVSTTNLQQALTAVQAGADYLGLGPMFPTSTKHKPTLAGPEYLEKYLADPTLAAIPYLAIGGITPENVKTLTQVGCRGVAVSSAVCRDADPECICRALLAYLPSNDPLHDASRDSS